MTTQSKIEWTDTTWNPVRGCTRVSPGCLHCYAERQAMRFSAQGQPYEGLVQITNGHPQWTGKIREVKSAIMQPFSWKKPRMVFVNSMSDLFHPGISREFLTRIFATMTGNPEHTFQILTKRPEYMVQVMPFIWDICNGGKPLENVWLGTSVEGPDQKGRIVKLRTTDAAVRFISFEPALADYGALNLQDIHWGIFGGESGPGARPCNLAWAENVQRQCREQNVAFFMKQTGSFPIMPREEWENKHNPMITEGLLKPKIGLWQSARNGPRLKSETEVAIAFADSKGGNPEEWPESLRVREFPKVVHP